jgi:hypothetical protein
VKETIEKITEIMAHLEDDLKVNLAWPGLAWLAAWLLDSCSADCWAGWLAGLLFGWLLASCSAAAWLPACAHEQ